MCFGVQEINFKKYNMLRYINFKGQRIKTMITCAHSRMSYKGKKSGFVSKVINSSGTLKRETNTPEDSKFFT